MSGYAAVILAGGAARRLGGVSKPMLPVGGRSMLARVLAAVPDARPRVVVGPPELALPPGVLRAQEQPPGGGPVAATAAGLARLDDTPLGPDHRAGPDHRGGFDDRAGSDYRGGPDHRAGFDDRAGSDHRAGSESRADADADAGAPADTSTLNGPGRGCHEPPPPADEGSDSGPVVALLAADLPFLTREAVDMLCRRLDAAGSIVDGVVFVDRDGRRQTLCGVWRLAALRARIDALDPLPGRSLRDLLAGLRIGEVSMVVDGPPPWYDCDQPEDLHRAEGWA
jgi:molybdopterin-guanine dinucleotide biosynthesis protein A